jgi:hypothetical protein
MDGTLKTAGEREAGVPCPHCRARILPGDEVTQCRACATVHHARCWDAARGCGAYSCAPARRDLPPVDAPGANGDGERIRISDEDIRRATPQPPRLPAYPAPEAHAFLAPPPDRRTSRLAIAGLVCAVLGIPLFGLLTGAVAVLLCCLALGEIGRSGRKGTGLALGGLVLGIGDIVGWIILIVVMFDGGGGGGAPIPAGKRITEEELKALPAPIAQAMRANVLIRVSSGWSGGLGSGVIVELSPGRAKVLTNRHVVEASSSTGTDDVDPSKLSPVTVDILGQQPAQGRVVWVAPHGIDLALVTVPCTSPTAAAVKWVRERPMRVGDAVFAIGNPHGWEWSHSQGTVSQFRQQNRGGRDVTIIQTTVPINPGNSGGGLYDAEGTLVGLNTWTADKRVSEGLSFAISLDVLPDLTPAPPLSATRPATTQEGPRP